MTNGYLRLLLQMPTTHTVVKPFMNVAFNVSLTVWCGSHWTMLLTANKMLLQIVLILIFSDEILYFLFLLASILKKPATHLPVTAIHLHYSGFRLSVAFQALLVFTLTHTHTHTHTHTNTNTITHTHTHTHSCGSFHQLKWDVI